MGSLARLRSVDLYGAMIRLYPQSFQKQYSVTMQQTFADMLDNEKSAFGRGLIWIRALLDLSWSAAKEHITDGKDIFMNKTTKLVLVGAVIAIIVVGLGSFWEGNLHARTTTGVERVTVAELADAMQQDHFYSSYGSAAVLFNGKISDVSVQGDASLVTFTTGRSYNVVCQFSGVASQTFTAGQTISVVAPAGSADRQAHGVLLHGCLVN